MITNLKEIGTLSLHLSQDGPVGAVLYLHKKDHTGLRLNREDIHDVLNRVRLIELGYDRWGLLLPLNRGTIIFEKERIQYRANGSYHAAPVTLSEISALADALAGHLEAQRRTCHHCGEPLAEDLKARRYHPDCRKRAKAVEYSRRYRERKAQSLNR